jgi:hypothetical protein
VIIASCVGTAWPSSYRHFLYQQKLDLRKMGRQGLHWIDLAQDNDGWCDFVNAVMNFLAP